MQLRTFLKPLSFLPAILMMYIIFSFSGQQADVSSSLSYKVSLKMVRTANDLFDTNIDDYRLSQYAYKVEGLTRKAAHVGEYFLLAVAVSFPLYVYGLHGILLVLSAGIFCVAFAALDEYHQTFVSGRSGKPMDVAIDAIGILIGILLVRIIGWTGRKTIFAPHPDDEYRQMTAQELKALQKQQRRLESQLQSERRNRQKEEYQRKKAERQEKEFAQQQHADPTAFFGQGVYRQPWQDSQGNPYQQVQSRQDSQGRTYPQEQSYPNYQDSPYRQGPSYRQDPHLQDQPYQNHPYPQKPSYYDGMTPPYDYEAEEETTSDELSEDMPFSRLLQHRK